MIHEMETPRKLRHGCVMRIEMLSGKEGTLVLLTLLVATVGAIVTEGQNDRLSTDETPMWLAETTSSSTLWTGNASSSTLTFLSSARVKIEYNKDAMEPDPESISLAVDFFDETGKSLDDESETHTFSCVLDSTCIPITLPKRGVYPPDTGDIWVNVTIYNSSDFVPENAAVFIQLVNPTLYITVPVRVVLFAAGAVHAYKYVAYLGSSTDPIQAEHHLVVGAFVFLLVYINIFFPLTFLKRTGTGWDQLVAVLIFQLPLLTVSYAKGATFAALRTIFNMRGSRADEIFGAYKRVSYFFVPLVVLQMAYCAEKGSAFDVVGDQLLSTVGLARGIVNLAWLVATVVLLCDCCCLGWSAKAQLRRSPYVHTRDRQMFVRLLIFVVYSLLVVVVASLASAEGGPGQIGIVIYISFAVHVLAWASTPVFLKSKAGAQPPPPTTDAWRKTAWRREWFDWIERNPTALSLYYFVTEEQEDAFWRLQGGEAAPADYFAVRMAAAEEGVCVGQERTPSSEQAEDGNLALPLLLGKADAGGEARTPETWSEPSCKAAGSAVSRAAAQFHPFNFERCLWACHLSGEVYKKDCHSTAISAAAAGLLAAAAAVAQLASDGGIAARIPCGKSSFWAKTARRLRRKAPSAEPGAGSETQASSSSNGDKLEGQQDSLNELNELNDHNEPNDLDDFVTSGLADEALQPDADVAEVQAYERWQRESQTIDPEGEIATAPSTVIESSSFFSLVKVHSVAGMQCLMGTTASGFFVIAFRGSSNMRNWRDNSKVPRQPWDELAPDPSADGRPLAHSGFLKIWSRVKPFVEDSVARYAGARPLLVAGHSLGGAMATLCGYSLRRAVANSVEVWTFGSPHVGNAAFARAFDKGMPNCFRVVNENDAITRCTLTYGNRHVGKYVLLGVETGVFAANPTFFDRWWSPSRCLWNSAIAHSMVRYQAALNAAFRMVSSRQHLSRPLPPWISDPITRQHPCCCCQPHVVQLPASPQDVIDPAASAPLPQPCVHEQCRLSSSVPGQRTYYTLDSPRKTTPF
ncbi:Phospholipase A(1) DAD1 [Diplonema papillatum]|nr:Phospholipase A(1) DAD1 [Diplonema papillatum]